MSNLQHPRRQRRLDQTVDTTPSYFLTLCTNQRERVLDNEEIMGRVHDFITDSFERYGVYVDCFMLMPDHVHLIVMADVTSDITIGQWVKAFKAMVSLRQFKWQSGFFDHVLRSDEGRSEKWEYIRMNPVRAELVEYPEEWPFSRQFNRRDGSEL